MVRDLNWEVQNLSFMGVVFFSFADYKQSVTEATMNKICDCHVCEIICKPSLT